MAFGTGVAPLEIVVVVPLVPRPRRGRDRRSPSAGRGARRETFGPGPGGVGRPAPNRADTAVNHFFGCDRPVGWESPAGRDILGDHRRSVPADAAPPLVALPGDPTHEHGI